jgi:hypothetical protein
MPVEITGLESVLRSVVQDSLSEILPQLLGEIVRQEVQAIMDSSVLLDTAQAGQVLNVTGETIRHYRDKGDLPWVDFGPKSPRYRLSDILALAKRRLRQTPTAEEWASMRQGVIRKTGRFGEAA